MFKFKERDEVIFSRDNGPYFPKKGDIGIVFCVYGKNINNPMYEVVFNVENTGKQYSGVYDEFELEKKTE